MNLNFYQVDAFAERVFTGNPAAVCPLEKWLPDETMQSIATENNLSETAFYVPEGDGFGLRWFTPVSEVDLCGHATLATAHVLVQHEGFTGDIIRFSSRSGELRVKRDGDRLALDFPARPGDAVSPPEALVKGIGREPVACYRSRDYMAVLESEADVLACRPDHLELSKLEATGIIITAPASSCENNYDFVSRFFAPREGIPEDAVTGSAHCTLIPYWTQRLEQSVLTAFQCSPRGGMLYCRSMGDRVSIAGTAVTYARGSIFLP